MNLSTENKIKEAIDAVNTSKRITIFFTGLCILIFISLAVWYMSFTFAFLAMGAFAIHILVNISHALTIAVVLASAKIAVDYS